MRKRWISPQTAAEYIDFSVRTIYRLERKGELVGAKIGGSLRIDLESLEQYLESKVNERRKHII